MGEFSGEQGVSNNIDMGGTIENGYDTDVEGVKSNDIVKYGKDEYPCFDVSKEEFYQNMQDGRRRLRWKSDTPVQKYMAGSKYARPFFVRTTDENGKQFVRKIK